MPNITDNTLANMIWAALAAGLAVVASGVWAVLIRTPTLSGRLLQNGSSERHQQKRPSDTEQDSSSGRFKGQSGMQRFEASVVQSKAGKSKLEATVLPTERNVRLGITAENGKVRAEEDFWTYKYAEATKKSAVSEAVIEDITAAWDAAPN